jgi:hypothetical protein
LGAPTLLGSFLLIFIENIPIIVKVCDFPVMSVTGSRIFGTSLSIAEGKTYMAKRRGNPNWGKPEPIGPVVPTVTSFEQVVKEFKLTPDQYIRSTRLREWARRNRNSKYIPESLLEAWGFEIESTL